LNVKAALVGVRPERLPHGTGHRDASRLTQAGILLLAHWMSKHDRGRRPRRSGKRSQTHPTARRAELKLPTVSYKTAVDLRSGYDGFVLDLARRNGVTAVAELGGGANPVLANTETWGFVQDRVVFDISAAELAKADDTVETRVADLCKPILETENSYDLVFSKMLCEHLPDARTFHSNCYSLLRPGGLAVHIFPTLYAVPFVINRVLPENVGRAIVRRVQPGRLENPKLDKFPALYNWCAGPTQRTLKRYRSVGFEVVEWNGAYGHNYYKRLPPLQAAEEAKSRFLLRHPIPFLTSFAATVLRKPN
jgi:SAM-dependent methyltransferase